MIDSVVTEKSIRRMAALCILLAGLAAALVCVHGCSELNPRPPVEAFAQRLADEAIFPAVREGLTRGVDNLSIQAGAQGISPAYVIEFSGKWVVGIEGRASVGVEGVAGQVQIASVSPATTQAVSRD